MTYSSSGLLSDDAVRATCVKTFQKRLYDHDHATGRAEPRLDEQTVSWEGILQNKTSDHVTTWVQISVNIYDEDGRESEFNAETQIWIDPLGEAKFTVDLPELKRELLDGFEFCDHEDIATMACSTWRVTEIMGLAI